MERGMAAGMGDELVADGVVGLLVGWLEGG